MSAWTTAYCGICGLPMAGGMGSLLRCPDDQNVAHNQWGGRPTFMLPPAPRDAEITALRAALDQERADNEKARAEVGALRAFALELMVFRISDNYVHGLAQRHGLVVGETATALLSGRGEGGGNG